MLESLEALGQNDAECSEEVAKAHLRIGEDRPATRRSRG
jgi:hypothetical protein